MASGSFNASDAAAGGLFVAIGLIFGIEALGLEIGTSLRMGPGYFPLVLAGLLILLGTLILISSLGSGREELGALAWRGMLFILPAPVFFGLTVRGLGFVPSIFLTALIAGAASAKLRPLAALALAAGITVFCTAVFSYGLGLPFRRFGPWLPF